MSEAVSALGGVEAAGAVDVAETGPVGMVTVRGDLAADAIQAGLRDVIGADVPAQLGATSGKGGAVLWMSPDEILIVMPYEGVDGAIESIREKLVGTHHLVADVSDARAFFRLEGTSGQIRDTLAKVTPADLRPNALPVGVVRRTRLQQVAAAIWFASETQAHVVCFRSVAGYVFDLLRNAANAQATVDYF